MVNEIWRPMLDHRSMAQCRSSMTTYPAPIRDVGQYLMQFKALLHQDVKWYQQMLGRLDVPHIVGLYEGSAYYTYFNVIVYTLIG